MRPRLTRPRVAVVVTSVIVAAITSTILITAHDHGSTQPPVARIIERSDATPSPTDTPTDTPVATDTPTPTAASTDTPTPVSTAAPTSAPTPTPKVVGYVCSDGVTVEAPGACPTAKPTPVATATPVPTPTPNPCPGTTWAWNQPATNFAGSGVSFAIDPGCSTAVRVTVTFPNDAPTGYVNIIDPIGGNTATCSGCFSQVIWQYQGAAGTFTVPYGVLFTQHKYNMIAGSGNEQGGSLTVTEIAG